MAKIRTFFSAILIFAQLSCRTMGHGSRLNDVDAVETFAKNDDGTYDFVCKDGSRGRHVTYEQVIAAEVCTGTGDFPLRFYPRDAPGYSKLPTSRLSGVAIIGNTWLVSSRAGISISKDLGDTWVTRKVEGLPSEAIETMAAAEDVIVAVGAGKVAVSLDVGNTWQVLDFKKDLSVQTPYPVHLTVDKGGVVAVRYIHGVAISRDGGHKWRYLESGGGLPSDFFNAITVSLGGGYIYVGCEDGVVLRSKDGGVTWERKTLGDSVGPFSGVSQIATTDGKNVFAIKNGWLFASGDYGDNWTSLRKASEIFIAGGLLFGRVDDGAVISVSRDGGKTWGPIDLGSPLVSSSLNVSGVAISGQVALVSTGSGLAVSKDSLSKWKMLTVAWPEFCSQVSVQGPLVVAGGDCGIFVSSDSGLTFSGAATYRSSGQAGSDMPDNSGMSFKAMAGDNSIFVFRRSGIRVSHDKGISWSDKIYPKSTSVFGGTFDTSSGNVFSVTDSGLWRSADGGDSWSAVEMPSGMGAAFKPLVVGNRVFVTRSPNRNFVPNRLKPFFGPVDSSQPLIDLSGSENAPKFVYDWTAEGSTIVARDLNERSRFFVSLDSGDSWRAKPVSSDVDLGERCKLMKMLKGLLYLGCTDGVVWITDDVGGSWRNLRFDSEVTSIAANQAAVFFVTKDGRFFVQYN